MESLSTSSSVVAATTPRQILVVAPSKKLLTFVATFWSHVLPETLQALQMILHFFLKWGSKEEESSLLEHFWFLCHWHEIFIEVLGELFPPLLCRLGWGIFQEQQCCLSWLCGSLRGENALLDLFQGKHQWFYYIEFQCLQPCCIRIGVFDVLCQILFSHLVQLKWYCSSGKLLSGAVLYVRLPSLVWWKKVDQRKLLPPVALTITSPIQHILVASMKQIPCSVLGLDKFNSAYGFSIFWVLAYLNTVTLKQSLSSINHKLSIIMTFLPQSERLKVTPTYERFSINLTRK